MKTKRQKRLTLLFSLSRKLSWFLCALLITLMIYLLSAIPTALFWDSFFIEYSDQIKTIYRPVTWCAENKCSILIKEYVAFLHRISDDRFTKYLWLRILKLSDTIQYFGIIVVAISSIVTLLGKPRERGRFTKYGKVLLGLIVIGALTAVIGNSLTREKSSAMARIEREWGSIEQEDLDWLKVGFYVTGEAQISDLLSVVKKFRVSIKEIGKKPHTSESEIVLNLVHAVDKAGPVQSISLCVKRKQGQAAASSYPIKLYRLEVSDGRLSAVHSSDHVWKNLGEMACGISGLIPWSGLGLHEVRRIKDLENIEFFFELPKDLDLEVRRFGRYEPSLFVIMQIRSHSFLFWVDPAYFGFMPHTDHTVAPKRDSKISKISELKLLTYFREQFFESGGVDSHKTRVPKGAQSWSGVVIRRIEERLPLR